MAVIESTVSPSSEAFAANRAGMLALIERIRDAEGRAVAASNASRKRFESRGQLLPRERIYREVKVMMIGGGSEEIMKDLAARQLGI